MKSNLSRWGLSRYYITKEGILYFKTLNKGWVKKPFRLLESKKRKKYTQSLLNDEGKYVYGYLHRLVALAWIPNPNNYPIVCHKDNVVTHNWYKNLYWGTQKDNMQQCIRDGRTLKGNKNPMYGISRRGAANPNAKLSKAQRREIRFRYESREKICRLANEFKVSRLTIRRIVNPSLRSFNRLV